MSLLFNKQLKELKKFVNQKAYIPFEVGEPKSLTGEYHKKFLESIGFVIEKELPGFYKVKFPRKWKYFIPLGSDRWCYLMDNFGRRRAAVYYFYMTEKGEGENAHLERKVSTHINWMPRFRLVTDHVVRANAFGTSSDEHYDSPLIGRIIDGETETSIFETDEVALLNKRSVDKKAFEDEERKTKDILYARLVEHIKKIKPDYESIIKYWDEHK
jgi:hypothetical protein